MCLRPWPSRLSWLNIIRQSERSPGRFPVRAHDWVATSSWSGCRWEATYQCFSHTSMFPSLSPSLPLSLRINKVFFNLKKKLCASEKNWKPIQKKWRCLNNKHAMYLGTLLGITRKTHSALGTYMVLENKQCNAIQWITVILCHSLLTES